MASQLSRRIVAALLLGLLLLLLGGCRARLFRSDIVVQAAWDVWPIADRARAQAALLTGKPITIGASTTSVESLKRGEADLVILGREPTPEELEGLSDEVIGYDAVCILIDSNSYTGGDVGRPKPVANSIGIRNMSLDELKKVFGFWSSQSEGRWDWRGGIIRLKDAGKDKVTGQVYQQWFEEPATIAGFVLVPKKYDTQASLYDKLGLSEDELVSTVNSFATPWLSTEEEVIAWEFPNSTPFTVGSTEFRNKVGFASLRVTQLAIRRTAVSVVSVDKIEPLADPQVVYSGRYALSRKIHVLTLENRSEEVDQVVEYLLSDEGQRKMEEIGFLPLRASRTARTTR